MRFPAAGLWLAVATIASSFGCASTMGVRYVYQDGDYGVLGLPENTDCWPTFYRTRADKMMSTHFPKGYEVVRAEEVADGSRTTKVEGTHTAEVSPSLAQAGLNVAKLGGSTSRSQADTTTITECRIIYRRAEESALPGRYAEAPGLTPTLYLDPNAVERRKATEPPAKSKPLASEQSPTPNPAAAATPARGDG